VNRRPLIADPDGGDIAGLVIQSLPKSRNSGAEISSEGGTNRPEVSRPTALGRKSLGGAELRPVAPGIRREFQGAGKYD
jgi:hypothetical protein